MAHLKDNIKHPAHTNPFFWCVSYDTDPEGQKKLGGAEIGG
jgi:hypothetical protein